MGLSLLANLRHETRFVIRIALRDMVKRLMVFALIVFVCYFGGATGGLIPVVILAALSEVAAILVSRRLRHHNGDVTTGMALAMWTINVVSTALYLWPAYLLSSEGSIPLLLSGFLWLFGTLVHVTNTFVALPIYNRSQMVPSTLMALACFWIASGTAFEPGNVAEWWVASALMGIYVANTFETILAQKDTQSALDAARADASARLVALERMSRQDSLTGLINRRAFDEVLDSWLAQPKQTGTIAVFIIDLDGFKPVNDTYSHAAGDAVLITLARRLAHLTSGRGLAARLGGDEFVIALRSVGGPTEAEAAANEMLAEIERPIPYADRLLQITGSLGIALAGPGLRSVTALCAAADRAMFRAKADNDQRVAVYDPAEHPFRASLEDQAVLARALREGEIRPHYQPKVRLDSGTIIGFEALARWHHPTRGILLPGEFLPQINELGLQGDFQTAIARQAMRDISALVEEGFNPGQVSINIAEAALATVSGRRELDQIVSAYPLARGHLTMEITEDVFIARAGGMIQASIAYFRSLGIRMTLDDFGTGFASFQHLRQFEFDELKVDRSFVNDLGGSGTADVLVEGFVQIARGLGIAVIAEGVETDQQRRHLMRMGCDLGQGFLYGAAMTLDEVRVRLTAPPTVRLVTRAGA